MRASFRRSFSQALIVSLLVTTGASAEELPRIEANQNHTSAGVLHNGVLTVQLEIAKGLWHPEADDGIALSVYAFGEAGHALQNPGPLIRVPEGTDVHASVHNALSASVTLHGLGDPASGEAVLDLAPGEVRQVSFKAPKPGLYFYWAASENRELKQRHGIDSELTGAFVVDPPGKQPADEIFVISLISDLAGPGARQTLATINGKSWPYTQRFRYEIGEPVHWRWINASAQPHAMHLHGFFYRIEGFNHRGVIDKYVGDSRPQVVTQRIAIGDTFDMSWSPERAGQWLFHCHMLQHMTPPTIPLLPELSIVSAQNQAHVHADHSDTSGMGQLVLGITVPTANSQQRSPDWQPRRKLQLTISERSGLPRYALRLRENSQPSDDPPHPGLIGPPIVLTRGEPVEIEVVNRLQQPTAIHWHGIEIESYYDGVPGWSGSGTQITPPIPPGGSFVARLTPPRAGTFIYHTHWHDPEQLLNGLYGPLIVMPPGKKFDPASDLTFVFSVGEFSELNRLILINGSPQSPPLPLQSGRKYRLRLINISPNNVEMQVSLRNTSGPVSWRIIAKDGADLPPEQIHPAQAQLPITVGETYDVEFTSDSAQDLRLELLAPGLKIQASKTLSFVAPPAAAKN